MKTDEEYKRLLAEMLPEKYFLRKDGTLIERSGWTREVLESEYLDICREIELGLKGSKDEDDSEKTGFLEELTFICAVSQDPVDVYNHDLVSASWQQRTEALAATKGVAG